MQIELRIDESCREPRVVILADGMVEVLDPDEICRVSALGGKVYAQTSRGEVQLRLRLY